MLLKKKFLVLLKNKFAIIFFQNMIYLAEESTSSEKN